MALSACRQAGVRRGEWDRRAGRLREKAPSGFGPLPSIVLRLFAHYAFPVERRDLENDFSNVTRGFHMGICHRRLP